MKKPSNPPAFPQLISLIPNMRNGFEAHTETGISLRDYFAAKAMQSIVSSPRWNEGEPNNAVTANWAYAMADAMLAEREKTTP